MTIDKSSNGNGGAILVSEPPAGLTRENGSVRVVLFDIDGTLIRPARRPEYRGAIREILIDVFGTFGRIDGVDFRGKTDLAIYREALEPEGIEFEIIRERLPMVESAMVDLLDRMASTGDVYHLCSGVRELLEAMAGDRRFLASLLTGNVERLAEAKLRVAGIGHYFRGRGAFGSDHENRDHLPAIAAERLSALYGLRLAPERFIIVGDTPRDISCARHFGARVLAVASGQHTTEELKAFEPDALLEDLSDTRAVIELLAEL
jgi:phosphoglycolate phosphatase-like HAD superfamily hydrolase